MTPDLVMQQLLNGALATVQMCILAIPFATVLGILLGMVKNSRFRWASRAVAAYIWLLRAIPLLLLLFFVYFAVPEITGGRIPAFPAAVASLTLHGAAYIAEIVYGSVRSVPLGQWAAARSLGLRFRHIIAHVVGPQTLRVALPPTISTYTIMVKESSLAAVIGHVDILGAALAMRESQIRLEFGVMVLALAAILYFILCFGLSSLGRAIEQRQHWTARRLTVAGEVT